MTTLAIIGSGILGRSLVYTLAKEQKSFGKIFLFHSEKMAFPCSLHSTAIVAPRGLSFGHSPLGDLLLQSFQGFKEHVDLDAPAGVERVLQFTGASTKLENFKLRYPQGSFTQELPALNVALKRELYVAQEEAFLIDPESYNHWLLEEAAIMKGDEVEVIEDFVAEFLDGERIHLKTQSGRTFIADKVVFAGGSYNRYWKSFAQDKKLSSSQPVQGSYLEYDGVDLGRPSFSLTLEGDNLIWNNPLKRLLIGSTTASVGHALPPRGELQEIHSRLSGLLDLSLPNFHEGVIKVGLREKAQKREPYLVQRNNAFWVGGLYKNGYSLALKMSTDLSHQYL